MAYFVSKSPPTFDPQDIAGTVQAIIGYLHELQETLNFTLEQIEKEIAKGGAP